MSPVSVQHCDTCLSACGQGAGRALVIAALDLLGSNPWSRVPNSEFRSLDGIRSWIISCVRASEDTTRDPQLPPMDEESITSIVEQCQLPVPAGGPSAAAGTARRLGLAAVTGRAPVNAGGWAPPPPKVPPAAAVIAAAAAAKPSGAIARLLRSSTEPRAIAAVSTATASTSSSAHRHQGPCLATRRSGEALSSLPPPSSKSTAHAPSLPKIPGEGSGRGDASRSGIPLAPSIGPGGMPNRVVSGRHLAGASSPLFGDRTSVPQQSMATISRGPASAAKRTEMAANHGAADPGNSEDEGEDSGVEGGDGAGRCRMKDEGEAKAWHLGQSPSSSPMTRVAPGETSNSELLPPETSASVLRGGHIRSSVALLTASKSRRQLDAAIPPNVVISAAGSDQQRQQAAPLQRRQVLLMGGSAAAKVVAQRGAGTAADAASLVGLQVAPLELSVSTVRPSARRPGTAGRNS